MNIIFYPCRSDATLTLSVAGDVLSVNGTELDFSAVPPGATLPRAAIACPLIAGDVERDGSGLLTVPVILPLAAEAPAAARFPLPLTEVPDDIVTLPGEEL